jgi:amino acid transporter
VRRRPVRRRPMMVVNFCLNKFCPTLIIGSLLFLNFDVLSFEPWAIIGLLVFSQHFHYKSGYAMAYCESKGIDLD